MPQDHPSPQKIYHIAEAEAWPWAEEAGSYSGGPVCQMDGFIHFSTREQLPGTLARFFAGRDDLILLECETAQLAPALRWERMGEDIFPHYYAPLRLELARNLGPIRFGADGRHVLPPPSDVVRPEGGAKY